MRSTTAVKKPNDPPSDRASALLREIDEANTTLNACLSALEEVLARPVFVAGALTSVRLRLAGIRLTHGPLIARVADFLAGQVSAVDQAALEDLRNSHQRILQVATAHTSKWTLAAIGKDWFNYRRETRVIVKSWRAKSDQDAKLVQPLMRKAIGR